MNTKFLYDDDTGKYEVSHLFWGDHSYGPVRRANIVGHKMEAEMKLIVGRVLSRFHMLHLAVLLGEDRYSR